MVMIRIPEAVGVCWRQWAAKELHSITEMPIKHYIRVA